MIVVCVVAGLAAGCKKKGAAADPEAREDLEACREALADPETAEALEWLARGDTMGFELGKPEMRELAQSFYDAGADRVHVAYSELEDDGLQIGALLIVELPRSARARGPVFARFEEIREDFELDRARDVGQSCLLVGLD